LIIFLFGTVVYFVFKTNQIASQNRLWAGMAKETAHQIGTPLSSLIGWIALMKEKEGQQHSLQEIEKDVNRLRLITDRFSKIGSLPTLEQEDIVGIVAQTSNYLAARSSKWLVFDIQLPQKAIVIPCNALLMSWTLENIIKNGIDAMKGKGTLGLTLEEQKDRIIIQISDTGGGIKKEDRKKIFSPGFSTKAHGWGLGLSLAKRIVVDYHKGKIGIKHTQLGKGTQFEIILFKAKE
ncbi:MAG: sensor histidine kinase, partial [Flavobacteriaceae bacterium]